MFFHHFICHCGAVIALMPSLVIVIAASGYEVALSEECGETLHSKTLSLYILINEREINFQILNKNLIKYYLQRTVLF